MPARLCRIAAINRGFRVKMRADRAIGIDQGRPLATHPSPYPTHKASSARKKTASVKEAVLVK
jgi:hypothetical protein